jgi:RloB-like protein
MAKGKQRFVRQLGERRYRKLFLVAVEGEQTEPQYFALLNEGNAVVKVHCLSSKRNTPPKVLALLKSHINKISLRKDDETWLVVDKDSWTDQQLAPLFDWSQTKDQYGFCLSNPKFEYWLLLHFEDSAITSSRDCSEKLQRHLQDYDKHIKGSDFPEAAILLAVDRAKRRDSPPCQDWPRAHGTTVYKLVERIIRAQREL